MKRLSVVIPVYNAARYLCGCLDSVLAQQVDSMEVICVDDGSTDGSDAILAGYAADSRVRILTVPHGGAYVARARGLQVAQGEFIHFMDADDEMTPTAYAECLALAERENLDQIVFGADVFSDDEESARFRRLRRRYRKYYRLSGTLCGKTMSGIELMDGMRQTGALFVGPPLRIVRRRLLTENAYDFPDAPFHADNYFTVASLFYAQRVQASCHCYFRRRLRAGSISTATGNEEVHLRCIANVLRALLHFRPLQAAAGTACISLAGYVIDDMLSEFSRRARDCPRESVLGVLREVEAEDGPAALVLASGLQHDAEFLALRPLCRAWRSFRRMLWRK